MIDRELRHYGDVGRHPYRHFEEELRIMFICAHPEGGDSNIITPLMDLDLSRAWPTHEVQIVGIGWQLMTDEDE